MLRCDRRVLHLIKMWLDCPVEETDRPQYRSRGWVRDRTVDACEMAWNRFATNNGLVRSLCAVAWAIHLPPADSLLSPAAAFEGREPGFPRGFGQLAWRPGQQRLAGGFDIGSTGGNISVGPYSSTALRLVVAPSLTRGRSVDL
jgi:hypothetical protein